MSAVATAQLSGNGEDISWTLKQIRRLVMYVIIYS